MRRVINILGGPAPVVSEGAAKSTPCESSGVSDAKVSSVGCGGEWSAVVMSCVCVSAIGGY